MNVAARCKSTIHPNLVVVLPLLPKAHNYICHSFVAPFSRMGFLTDAEEVEAEKVLMIELRRKVANFLLLIK